MNDAPPEPHVQYLYDLAALDRVPQGQTSLKVTARKLLSGPALATATPSTVGAVLTGERVVCTMGTQSAGTGAKAHSQPNEQFNYILRGTMMSDIEGDRVFASRGMILHTPGMAVHTGLACPEEDLVFFAIKDTRPDIVEPRVDGEYDEPSFFPGFGSRADEPRLSTEEVMAESRKLPPGPGKRYVYNMLRDADAGRTPASAVVTADADLRLPPGITGKLLTGERLHVGVLRLQPGATFNNYRRDNEQIFFVAEGAIEADLNDEHQLEVGLRCLLHVPAGMRHTLTAPDGAVLVIAQDKGDVSAEG